MTRKKREETLKGIAVTDIAIAIVLLIINSINFFLLAVKWQIYRKMLK